MRAITFGLVLGLAGWSTASASGGDEPPPGTVRAHLAEIAEAQQETSTRYHRDYEAARSDPERQAVLDRFQAETDAHCDAALALARKSPKDPGAVEALQFVVRTARAGPSDHSARAIAILRDDHADAEGMGEFAGNVFYLYHLPQAERLLREVAQRHPSREQRGLASYWLIQYLDNQARMVRKLRDDPEFLRSSEETRGVEATAAVLREKDPDQVERQAVAERERLIREFGDVPAGGRTLGAIAEGELFASRNLQVGQVAPEIEGRDADDAVFRLSDYRGKVVVLTFSGQWCGPCRGMYPQERAMVERLSGKPFALLSVDTDEDVATLHKGITDGEITWRCWWDGGPEGPITTRWGVSAFPTIFVLDRDGVIRHKDLRGDELDRAVDALLADEARGGDRP